MTTFSWYTCVHLSYPHHSARGTHVHHLLNDVDATSGENILNNYIHVSPVRLEYQVKYIPTYLHDGIVRLLSLCVFHDGTFTCTCIRIVAQYVNLIRQVADMIWPIHHFCRVSGFRYGLHCIAPIGVSHRVLPNLCTRSSCT